MSAAIAPTRSSRWSPPARTGKWSPQAVRANFRPRFGSSISPSPADSLLLGKPTWEAAEEAEAQNDPTKKAHSGGVRFEAKTSPEYQTLLDWINGKLGSGQRRAPVSRRPSLTGLVFEFGEHEGVWSRISRSSRRSLCGHRDHQEWRVGRSRIAPHSGRLPLLTVRTDPVSDRPARLRSRSEASVMKRGIVSSCWWRWPRSGRPALR